MSDHLRPDDEVVTAYTSLRSRVVDLVRAQPAAAVDLPVPHCPAWTVGDLLAHMVGVPEDILAGRLDGVGTDAWTQAQVDRHSGRSLDELADAWMATAPAFDEVLPMIPTPMNSQLVLDVTTHEHDLRHALGVPGARDDLAVTVALGFVLHTADEASPGLAGQLLSSGIDDFDLLRACSGRRSREQIAALGFDPDLAATMVAGSPVSLPSATVDE
jgi:uncharacterized protein (TIGR03083 family)